MNMFKQENGKCRVIEEACPYEDREGCYHCLLYNAAEIIIERIRAKEAKERKHD